MLRFQANSGILMIANTTFTGHRSVEQVAGVKLQPGLSGEHFLMKGRSLSPLEKARPD